MAASSELKSSSKTLKDIKEKTKLILESKVNANLLVDLLEFADSKDEKVVVAFIRAVYKIFITLMNRGELFPKVSGDGLVDKESKSQSETEENPQEIFAKWLHEKYLMFIRKLLELMHHGGVEVREFAVCTLMKFVVGEGARRKATAGFPNTLFMKIVEALLEPKHDMRELISRFVEYLEYDDIKFYVLKNMSKVLGVDTNKAGRILRDWPYFVGNAFALLSQVKIAKEEEELDTFLVTAPSKPEKQAKVFSSAWLAFLQYELPSDVHKKVLVNLHCDVIPHLTDPKLLIDFLSDSYDTGGATSLLALNGLFILIHQYNLDYPDFYKKLYALFEPTIFHVKYKERFFHLADLFLTSTHLPAYLVAAFAKRLSRMALSAPPSGIMLAIPFVCNLLRRHSSCQVLIHRKQAVTLFVENGAEQSGRETHTTDNDPYRADETDPAKSNALDSCLWELQTLQSHYYPGVRSLVQVLEKPLKKEKESDISDFFDISYQSLFEQECDKFTSKNSFLEFQPPKGILGKEFSDFWTL